MRCGRARSIVSRTCSQVWVELGPEACSRGCRLKIPGQRMDYTIDNNAKLFDELLAVLSKHREEPGVAAAFEDLKAAKFNYVQRSIDHMMSCLVLTLYDVISQ